MKKNVSPLFALLISPRTLLWVFMFSILSCVNLRLDIKKDVAIDENVKLTSISQKMVFLKVNYDDNSDTNLSKNKKIEMNRIITHELISWLKSYFNFQDVREYSSDIKEVPVNTVVLKVRIDEKNIEGKSWWNIAARTLSF